MKVQYCEPCFFELFPPPPNPKQVPSYDNYSNRPLPKSPKPPKYGKYSKRALPRLHRRSVLMREIYAPQPVPKQIRNLGSLKQDPELSANLLNNSQVRRSAVSAMSSSSLAVNSAVSRHSSYWKSQNKPSYQLVDPSLPKTMEPYFSKQAAKDPREDARRKVLDPAGLVMTAREFILVMGFPRRNALQLNTLYWVPYNFGNYLELAKLLVRYEYTTCIQGNLAILAPAQALLRILSEISRLVHGVQNPSLLKKSAKFAQSTATKNQKSAKAEQELSVLDALARQARHELTRLQADYIDTHGKANASDPVEFFEALCEDVEIGNYLPPHLKCGVGKWYAAEKVYQFGSLLRSSGDFAANVMSSMSGFGSAAAGASGMLGPVSVVLAPVATVFEGKHLRNNKINKKAIRSMIADLKNTGKVKNRNVEAQMLADAGVLSHSEFASKYGGKINYQQVNESIASLQKRIKSINRGTTIRWFKIAGIALGGACACAAIFVTGGVAAVVIMGVGIAAAVAVNSMVAKDIYDWTKEYDERWTLAHTLLEAARNESRYLKVSWNGQKLVYHEDEQIVPHPTIDMLGNMGILREPADAIYLQFSDAFIFTQVTLAMAIGNSAVADKNSSSKK